MSLGPLSELMPLRRVGLTAALWLLVAAGAAAQPVATPAPTTYGYDETGGKTTQVDALGRTTTWTIDAKERVTSRTTQDGAKETRDYDSEDNVLSRTTFAGETFSFQYDVMNRLVGEVIPSGTGTNTGIAGGSVQYGYTPVDMLQSRREQGLTTLNGVQTFKYDAVDRLIDATNPMGQISYSTDPMGNVLERSISGAGTVKSEYDDAGRLLKVIAPDGKQARYTYDPAGRMVAVERELNARDGQAQVLVSYVRHDDADRPLALAEVRRVGSTETLILGQAITRVAGGAVARIDTYRAGSYDPATGQFIGSLAATQAFEYGGPGFLTREKRTQLGTTTDTDYEYDAAGNRTKKTVTTSAGAEITTYTYDIADRLTQAVTSLPAGGTRVVTYTWDGNGNLASRTEPGKVTLYRFDPRNKLIDIRSGGTLAEAQGRAPDVRYAYDADGNRVRKWGADARSYLIDIKHAYPQLAVELSSVDRTDYVRGLGLIRQTRVTNADTEELFPLHGHMGTSLGAVNADGDLVEQISVDAFGNLDQPTVPKQTHLYTGEYWDQDGELIYLRARWYDPKIGRFVSADPFEGKRQNPRSLNRYAYAHGDPVHNTDPTGLFTLGEMNISINIQLAAVRQAFLTGGRQVGGKALQQLGKVVEEGVEKLIRNCLKPGAVLKNEKKLSTRSDGAKAVIDFFVEMGGKVKNIEVKYQLPAGSSSGGFARAAKQLQAMIDKGEEGLLVAYKQLKTDARAKKLLDSVSGNAGTVQVMEGFLGLGAFLGEMVIEGCIK